MEKLVTKLKPLIKYAFGVFLVIHLALLFLTQFTAWPEMTLWPYLMLNGWKPYQDIAIAHTPILLFDLTVFFKIFGVGVIQLKIFTWIYILVTDVVLYWVVKKLYGQGKALVTLAVFIVLSLIYQINGTWFDLALVPLALLIFYTLKTKKYVWVGFLWTVAFFTKQTAVWFLVPMGLQLFLDSKKNLKKLWHGVEYILLGFLGTTLIALLILAFLKVLPAFLSWAVSFGVLYLPKATGQISFPTVKQLLVAGFPFVVLLPYLSLFKKKADFPLLFWAFFACLGVFPRWELFHFLPALPFLAIITGETLLFKPLKYKKIFLGLGVVFLLGLGILFGKYLYRNLTREVRFYEPSVQELVGDIKSQTKEKGIFILNYWDSLYAYSGTMPVVKPWLPYLPWYLEYQNNKDKILKELKAVSPEMIIVGRFQYSGLGSYQQPDLIDFINRYYSLDKVVGEAGIYLKNK